MAPSSSPSPMPDYTHPQMRMNSHINPRDDINAELEDENLQLDDDNFVQLDESAESKSLINTDDQAKIEEEAMR